MELDFALLADAAATPPDGKLYLIGGGIETILSPKYPCMHGNLSLVMRFIFTPMDAGSNHSVKVILIDADGGEVIPALELSLPVPDKFPAMVRAGVSIVGNLQGLKFEQPGEYRFDISVDDSVKKSIPLYMMEYKAQPETGETGKTGN